MKMTLTVQSTGHNSYRFGINLSNSKEYFKVRHRKVNVYLDNIFSDPQTTCGSEKKGFDLYSLKISNWIISKKFNDYYKGKPTKLEFEFEHNGELSLTFIREIIRTSK